MYKIFYEDFYHGNGNKSIPIDESAIDVLRDFVPFVHHGGVFFAFFKLYKWYQIMKRITNDLT